MKSNSAIQLNSAEFCQQFSNSARANGISARAEKQEIRWLPLRSRSDLSGIKAIK